MNNPISLIIFGKRIKFSCLIFLIISRFKLKIILLRLKAILKSVKYLAWNCQNFGHILYLFQKWFSSWNLLHEHSAVYKQGRNTSLCKLDSSLVRLCCVLHIIMNFAVIRLQVKPEIMECGNQWIFITCLCSKCRNRKFIKLIIDSTEVYNLIYKSLIKSFLEIYHRFNASFCRENWTRILHPLCHSFIKYILTNL